ncbi:hypothetical protein [Risungbinella massiliensis]|uniref:hypothetical protein n=1 Tax=Risungbinella massiliensis TaxID=1329796 RepID=UPI00069A1E3C|nr:hypothetical protein [Risungbinella massiliensis]
MERKAVSEGIPQQDYRVGDVLRVTCPPTTALVAEVSSFYVTIDWPWGEIDPDSKYGWNGQVVFPTDPNSYEWLLGLFHTDPEPQHLVPGDTCLVGIPETLVHVVDVIHHDPLADIGWLPRPHTTLVVLHVNQSEETDEEDEDRGKGFAIELDSAAPIALEIVSRD